VQTAEMAKSNHVSACLRSARHKHQMSHGIEIPADKNKIAPPTLQLIARSSRPRIIQAQEVVIPHAGHRMPSKLTEVHGGKPNC